LDCFLGIDIGSATTKLVIMNESEIIGSRVVATGIKCQDTAQETLNVLLKELDLGRQDIKGITATGYGRRLVRFADNVISEISANVKGAGWFIGHNGNGEKVRTIINIGGQDSKVIALDEHGVTTNFAMNDKCAAGTGRFLETVSRILEVDVADLGELSLQAKIPIKINSTCAVFAESEIISLIARKKNQSEIIAGAHYSIARRIAKMAKRMGSKDIIFFDGGPAFNKGLVKALEDELATDIYVPRTPQITTALGAALLAKEAFFKDDQSRDLG